MKIGFERQTIKFLSAIIAVVLVISGLPRLLGEAIVLADSLKNQDNTCLGTIDIRNPQAPNSSNEEWKGSYVYYGKYYGQPIRYRVLFNNETKFGGNTLLLDCDKAIYSLKYDKDSNKWSDSDVRSNLLNSFAKTSFTTLEYNSISESTIANHLYTDDPNNGVAIQSRLIVSYANPPYKAVYIPLKNDKLFLLDYEDASNPAYGYHKDNGIIRQKTDLNSVESSYWLRSDQYGSHYVACVDSGGGLSFSTIDREGGVSPAFNVGLSSIVFSTLVSGSFGEIGAEYALTLKDSNLVIALSDESLTMEDATVTVPYQITGTDASKATRVSVLILDKEYTAGNTNAADILYYDSLTGTFSTSGSGSFTLPSSLNIEGWGEDYFVYVLAEDINSASETDYASEPVLLSVPDNISNQDSIPTFKGHGLVLSDEIGVKFRVALPSDFDTNNCFVDFKLSNGRTGTVNYSESVQIADSTDRYFTFGINALELADNITATLHYGNNQIKTDTYSAMEYINYIQANYASYPQGEKLLALVNALQDYGYYFQQSGWSDNANHNAITEPIKVLDASDVEAAINGVDSYGLSVDVGASGIDSNVKVALTLNAQTELKVSIKPDSGVSILTTGYIERQINNDTYYQFSVKKIGPKNLDYNYTFTIETTQGTANVQVSSLYYLNNMMNSGTLNENQMNALTAYYNYYYAAENY